MKTSDEDHPWLIGTEAQRVPAAILYTDAIPTFRATDIERRL